MELPMNIPLMAKTADAVKLFGVGRTRLYELRRDHEDFRALTVKTGKDILFDVPGVYEWLKQRGGGELE